MQIIIRICIRRTRGCIKKPKNINEFGIKKHLTSLQSFIFVSGEVSGSFYNHLLKRFSVRPLKKQTTEAR